MSSPNPTPTKAQLAYRKWYKANKVRFNKRRSEDYAKSIAQQQAARERQKLRRAMKPAPTADGHHYRKVKGRKVEVFRITAAAKMVGRDAQTIRTWETDGKIPEPTIKSTHRYYTMHQIKLMAELAELMTLVRWQGKVREVATANKCEEIKARWAGE